MQGHKFSNTDIITQGGLDTGSPVLYVIISQLLCVLLSGPDNAVCVNDIPKRTHSKSTSFMAAAKKMNVPINDVFKGDSQK